MRKTTNNLRKQVWVLLLPAMMAVMGAFWPAQPAAASMPIEVKELTIKAPMQEVDADGDGQLESFFAYGIGYTGGVAVGSASIGAHNMTLKRGLPRCIDGVDTAVLEGTLYDMSNGEPVEVGEVTVHASPARGSGGGGGGIDFDFDFINTAAVHYSFEAQGTLVFANPPCAS
jgi:hypothetical protein